MTRAPPRGRRGDERSPRGGRGLAQSSGRGSGRGRMPPQTLQETDHQKVNHDQVEPDHDLLSERQRCFCGPRARKHC